MDLAKVKAIVNWKTALKCDRSKKFFGVRWILPMICKGIFRYSFPSY